MLLKNGTEYNLEDDANKAELEAFLKAMPNFNETTPLVVKYHPNLLRYNNLNGRWESPEMRSLPNRQVINRPGKGNQTWIYCENYEQHASTNAILTRTPWDFDLTGTHVIHWINKDFAFFLWISQYCGNGEAKDTKTAVYVFQDKENDARKRLEADKLEARVKSLILNDDHEGGLSNTKIKEMAIAYSVPSTTGIYEMRQLLFEKASRVQNGFRSFLELLENPGEKERRMFIQRAKELGIVVLKGMKIEAGTGNNQAWRIFDVEGKTVKMFGKHRKSSNNANTNPDKYLWRDIDADQSLYKEIEKIMEAKEVMETID
jgi:hypothetical protein